MYKVIKILALLLAVLLLAAIPLASCGKSEDEDKTLSKGLNRPDKDRVEQVIGDLPAGTINELPLEEALGRTISINGLVKPGAETVTIRLNNNEDEAFVYGYMDILLQKKTGSGWETYRRTDSVPETGVSVQARGSVNEVIRPAQYGVELQAGGTYRILFANAPDVYVEFRVK